MRDTFKTIEILRSTLESMPDNIDVRAHMASLLLSLDKYEEAKEHFQEVIRMDSNHSEALLGLGKSNYYLKDLSDARIFLGKLLKLTDFQHSEANLFMAKSYIELNDIVNARDYYTKAVNIDPSVADDNIRSKLYKYETAEDDVELEEDNEEEFENELEEKGVRLYSAAYSDNAFNEEDIETTLKEKITFKDVGGLDNLKETIRHKIIHPFTNPEVYEAYGKKAGGGILLYGPPGCGKTFIAKATAGECDASFIDISINDVLDMWLGESEKKLHNIIEVARRKAPSIIFIDEIDALGGSRQAAQSNSTRMLVNQLLAEMDGLDSSNDKILFIGATNSPWFVDSALRRPGRFDRVVFCSTP